MTEKEYKDRLAKIEVAKEELDKEYAYSNNPYKIGDILKDHFHILKVESIKVERKFDSWEPECVYCGTQLTTKLEPKKRCGNTSVMYQSNVVKKLNKD